MLDAALRPRAFPREAGSLLPGLLAATRTGPSPAGDDELVVESRCSTHRPPTVWAHSGSSWNFGGGLRGVEGQTVTGSTITCRSVFVAAARMAWRSTAMTSLARWR